MLNGKFFTGLPPKMIDRNCSRTQNRQESHFFWPDDSKLESAVESRVKRRSSFHLDTREKPRMQHQSSLQTLGENVVDTKAKFHNEFGKSSIRFFDNMQDDQKTGGRKSLNVHTPSKELAPKPTAFKPQMPESVVDEAYIEAKKKEGLTSKIQFYDYVEQEQGYPRRSVMPKMDMNDKKEVERNSKNSPKLQNKRSVRNLSKEPLKSSDYERFDRANGKQNDAENYIEDPIEQRETPSHVRPRPSPIAMSRNNFQQLPRRILRTDDDAVDYFDDEYGRRRDGGYSHNDVSHAEDNMRRLSVRDGQRRHVSYEDEVYDDRRYEHKQRYYDNDDYYGNDSSRKSVTTHRPPQIKPQNIRKPPQKYNNEYAPTNVEQQQQQQQQQQLRQEERHQYMETGGDSIITTTTTLQASTSSPSAAEQTSNIATQRQLNNKNNNTSRIINDTRLNMTPPSRSAMQRVPPNVRPDADAIECTNNDKQKHLRSSLFFNNGEIVASNASKTSTSTAPSRRNARSAATQRVSVGLPD